MDEAFIGRVSEYLIHFDIELVFFKSVLMTVINCIFSRYRGTPRPDGASDSPIVKEETQFIHFNRLSHLGKPHAAQRKAADLLLPLLNTKVQN